MQEMPTLISYLELFNHKVRIGGEASDSLCPGPYVDGFLEGVSFLEGVLLDVGSDVSESCA